MVKVVREILRLRDQETRKSLKRMDSWMKEIRNLGLERSRVIELPLRTLETSKQREEEVRSGAVGSG